MQTLYYQDVYVAAAIVRWIRAEEFGVKTLVMDEDSRDVLPQRLGAESLRGPTTSVDGNTVEPEGTGRLRTTGPAVHWVREGR